MANMVACIFYKLDLILFYFRPNKKREFKNKKFGFGGQKKRSKMNTKSSALDMSEFNPNINQKKPGKTGKGKPKPVCIAVLVKLFL